MTECQAARELDGLRNNWLNPPEWTREEVREFPGSVDGPWSRYIDPATVQRVAGVEQREPPADADASQTGGSLRSTPATPHSGIGTVRYPRLVPRDEHAAGNLKKRTLTNLYNERPTWLDLAHRKLDEAVFAAYGWNPDITDDDLLAKLLELNLARAASER